MPNFETSAALVETATKCLAIDRLVAAEPAQQPLSRRVGVGHGLERREGFRRNDEQRLPGIEVARRFDEIGPIDVRHEPERHRALAIVLQRLVSHNRAEIGAADADIDDVPDALARMALPVAAPHAVDESAHAIEDRMNLRDDVFAVDDDRGSPRRAQRDMQHGAALGNVDLLAAKHRVDALAQARLLGELDEQLDGVVGDAILGVVEIDADGVEREPFAPRRIVGEELAQMDGRDRLLVGRERGPRGPLRKLCDARDHLRTSSSIFPVVRWRLLLATALPDIASLPQPK